MRSLFQAAADDNQQSSISHRLRARRFSAFARAVEALPKPVRILDIGGTEKYWEQRGWAGREDIQITLLNLEAHETSHANLVSVAGDATDLSDYADGSFDIAFSNSVIEHLFTIDAQRKMAAEIQRVAPRYWVQTPNFWFPVEPHFFPVIGWHWLPERARVEILMRTNVGAWAGRTPERAKAEQVIKEHRLMRRGEIAHLFPDATLLPERFGGLVKSWTAVGGLK